MIAAEPIRFQLYAPQAEFMRSESPVRGFAGGRGAGKSWTGAMDLLNRAKPNCFYFIGAPTYTVLEDASWRMFISLAEQRKMLVSSTSKPPFALLANGAEVIGRSADAPERFRGPNLSGAWLDEASQMSKEAFLLVLPCLREGNTQGWITGTFTPRGKAHWTYKVFGGDGADMIRARSIDSPWMPESLVKTLREQYTEGFAAQELEAEFLDDFGSQIRLEWLRYYDMQGDIIRLLDEDSKPGQVIDSRTLTRFATIDTAGSSKDKAEEAKGKVTVENNKASWSVCAVWDYWRTADLLLLRYVWRDRVGWADLKTRTADVLRSFNVRKTIIENATVGAALCSELKEFGSKTIPTVIPGMNEGVGQRGAKLERAIASGLLKRAEARKLVIPVAGSSPWVQRYIDEITGWTGEPNETADQIDVSSYAAWEAKNSPAGTWQLVGR